MASSETFTRSDGRRFAFPVGGAFVALAGLAAWRGHSLVALALGAVGALLLAAGILAPARLERVHRAWMAVARAISRITTPVFMGLVYFLLITPTGWLRRTLGSHPLRHPESDGGYWVSRGDRRRGDLERQF